MDEEKGESNDINNQLNQIVTTLHNYISLSSNQLKIKSKKLKHIIQIINWFIEKDEKIIQNNPLANLYQLIDDFQKEIERNKNTISSLNEKIVNLQSVTKTKFHPTGEKEANAIKQMKRKMKEIEYHNQIKEYQYLFYINDQNRQLKELHSKTPKNYPDEELKKIKLFPHLTHDQNKLLNDNQNNSICSTRPNKSRNKEIHIIYPLWHFHAHSDQFKLTSIETNVNYELTQDKLIMTERLIDNHKMNNHSRNVYDSIIKKENNRLLSDDKIHTQYNNNKKLNNIKNHYLKSNITQISDLLNRHDTNKKNNNLINRLMKKPIRVYNSSSKI